MIKLGATMNKIIKHILPLTCILVITACGNKNVVSTSSSELVSSSSVVESSSSRSESSSSSSSSSSTQSRSSSTSSISSSSSSGLVDMQLSNTNGMVVKFAKRGAKIDSIRLNDVKIAENGFVAGRVANRIANATFVLDGKTYNVNRNNGQHCLHGGSKGFGEIDWTKTSQSENQIVFELDSKDGDQGFPGNLHVSTTYTLSNDGELSIEYRAKCDAKTIFNPTNHLYMNMNGTNTNTWKNHTLWINADTYTEAKSDLIPTGNIVSVTGTTLDYTTAKSYVGNNDSNLVLKGEGFRKVAELIGDTSKIKAEVSTDRVGLQLYNDNSHICLEAQDFPDAIHHENFPSIILEANTDYYSKTSYKFSKIA